MSDPDAAHPRGESRKPALPDWPRRMRAKFAAAYADISERKFWMDVKAGKFRPPVKDGRTSFFYREDLDADLDNLKGGAQSFEAPPRAGEQTNDWDTD